MRYKNRQEMESALPPQFSTFVTDRQITDEGNDGSNTPSRVSLRGKKGAGVLGVNQRKMTLPSYNFYI